MRHLLIRGESPLIRGEYPQYPPCARYPGGVMAPVFIGYSLVQSWGAAPIGTDVPSYWTYTEYAHTNTSNPDTLNKRKPMEE